MFLVVPRDPEISKAQSPALGGTRSLALRELQDSVLSADMEV